MDEWESIYLNKWNSEIEVEELTIDEAVEKYNIDKESVGYDNGVFFNKIAMKVDNCGRYKVVQYLPTNSVSNKKFDFYVLIKTKG